MIVTRTWLALTAATVLCAPALAKDMQRVEAVNNVVTCNVHKEGWVVNTQGPCTDFKPPSTIAIGERFSEAGNSHLIGVIVAVQVEKDYVDGALTLKKGDWYCTAADSAEDLNMDSKKSKRTWLFIPKCIPVK